MNDDTRPETCSACGSNDPPFYDCPKCKVRLCTDCIAECPFCNEDS